MGSEILAKIILLNSKRNQEEISELIKKMSLSEFFQICCGAVEWGNDQLISVLFKIQNKIQHPQLTNEFLIEFIDFTLLSGHVCLFDDLIDKHPDLITEKSLAKKLINHPDGDYIKSQMGCFYISKDNPIISQEAIKLIFAAKKETSKLQSLIVVLTNDDLEEFMKKFSELIADGNPSIRLQFTYKHEVNNHAISGDIRVVEGKIEICIVETAGVKEILDSSYTTGEFILNTKKHLPQADIYCSVERIQHDRRSCAVMAVDNALHLRNADSYIPKPCDDLFDYLKAHEIRSHFYQLPDKSSVEIKLTTLPLRLIRTMQSLSSKVITNDLTTFFANSGINNRIDSHKNKAELESPINKKGETVQESLKPNIKNDLAINYLNNTPDKELNVRIQEKLKKYSQTVLNFLLAHDKNHVLDASQKFTPEEVMKVIEDQINTQKSSESNFDNQPSF